MNLSCKVEPCLHWRNKVDTCLQECLSAPVPNAPLPQRSKHVGGKEMMHFETCMASTSSHSYYQPLALWSTTLVFPTCRDCHMGLFIHTLNCRGAKLPAPLQLDPTSTASLTALLINRHAHFPLHPDRERSITED